MDNISFTDGPTPVDVSFVSTVRATDAWPVVNVETLVEKLNVSDREAGLFLAAIKIRSKDILASFIL